MWDAAKAFLRGKVVARDTCIKKQEQSQTNNLNYTPKGSRQRSQQNPKVAKEENEDYSRNT